jgi:hypothetical protein
VPGHDLYEVSNLGNVRSWWPLGRNNTLRHLSEPRPLKSHLRNGYLCVGLRAGGGRILQAPVHRLVVLAFIGPRPEGMQIRHLDGNGLNNTPGNLVYGTASENQLDKIRHGTDPNLRKTECPQGHPYDHDNTVYSTTGARLCRQCKLERLRAQRVEENRPHRLAASIIDGVVRDERSARWALARLRMYHLNDDVEALTDAVHYARQVKGLAEGDIDPLTLADGGHWPSTGESCRAYFEACAEDALTEALERLAARQVVFA